MTFLAVSRSHLHPRPHHRASPRSFLTLGQTPSPFDAPQSQRPCPMLQEARMFAPAPARQPATPTHDNSSITGRTTPCASQFSLARPATSPSLPPSPRPTIFRRPLPHRTPTPLLRPPSPFPPPPTALLPPLPCSTDTAVAAGVTTAGTMCSPYSSRSCTVLLLASKPR
jgi:hypothetical protein